MRRLVTVGAISVAGALVWACGDDEGPSTGNGGGGGAGGGGGSAGTTGNAGNAGNGGSAGNAGNGGSAGTGNAGNGGSAGTTGNAGSAGAAGSGNQPDAGDAGVDGDSGVADAAVAPPCTGCLELRVPFTASNQSAFFQITFTSDDLADNPATFRVRAQVLDQTGQLSVVPFGFDADLTLGAGTSTLMNAANFTDTNTFIDIPIDFVAVSTIGFDQTDMVALGLQVQSGGALAGPTTAVLLLDSITYAGTPSVITNLDFTADAQGFGINVSAGGLVAADGVQVIHH